MKSKIIEVEAPVFEYNSENPEEVRYTDRGDNLGKWKVAMSNTYTTGFPELRPGQILYRVKGTEDQGFILNHV